MTICNAYEKSFQISSNKRTVMGNRKFQRRGPVARPRPRPRPPLTAPRPRPLPRANSKSC